MAATRWSVQPAGPPKTCCRRNERVPAGRASSCAASSSLAGSGSRVRAGSVAARQRPVPARPAEAADHLHQRLVQAARLAGNLDAGHVGERQLAHAVGVAVDPQQVRDDVRVLGVGQRAGRAARHRGLDGGEHRLQRGVAEGLGEALAGQDRRRAAGFPVAGRAVGFERLGAARGLRGRCRRPARRSSPAPPRRPAPGSRLQAQAEARQRDDATDEKRRECNSGPPAELPTTNHQYQPPPTVRPHPGIAKRRVNGACQNPTMLRVVALRLAVGAAAACSTEAVSTSVQRRGAATARGRTQPRLVQRSRTSMGSPVDLSAWTTREADALAAFEAAFDEFDRLDGLLSVWREGSDVLRLNAAAGARPGGGEPRHAGRVEAGAPGQRVDRRQVRRHVRRAVGRVEVRPRSGQPHPDPGRDRRAAAAGGLPHDRPRRGGRHGAADARGRARAPGRRRQGLRRGPRRGDSPVRAA